MVTTGSDAAVVGNGVVLVDQGVWPSGGEMLQAQQGSGAEEAAHEECEVELWKEEGNSCLKCQVSSVKFQESRVEASSLARVSQPGCTFTLRAFGLVLVQTSDL